MGLTNTTHAVRTPRTPAMWMAILLSAAVLAALCTPALAADYTVTLYAIPNEGGTMTGAGSYASGTEVTVEAVAAPGYTFARWSTNAYGTGLESTDNPYAFTLTANKTLYAMFVADVPTCYTIDIGSTCFTDGQYADASQWANAGSRASICSPCSTGGAAGTDRMRTNSTTSVSRANYYPNIAYGGYYDVLVTFGYHPNSYNNVTYGVKDGNGSETTYTVSQYTSNQNVTVNQHRWNALDIAPFSFDRGQWTDTSKNWVYVYHSAGKYLMADATRFRWSHPSTPTITSGAPVTGGIDVAFSTVDLPGPGSDGDGAADGYYTIYRSETDGFEVIPGTTAPVYTTTTYKGQAGEGGYPDSLTYHDTDVVAGHTYYYKVCAWETGWADASSQTTVAYAGPPKATSPDPDDGATGLDPTSVSLNWSASGASAYEVWFDDGTGTLIDKGEQTETTYVASGLVQDQTYKWRIDTKNFFATTEGDVWTFTTGVPLTLTPSPIEGGTCAGGGYYAPGAQVSPTATPSTDYVFVKWSTDPEGTDTVTLPYEMPSGASTLYAIFETRYTKVIGARCGGAEVSYGSGWVADGAYSDLSPCGTTGCITSSGALSGAKFYPDFAFAGYYTAAVTFPQRGASANHKLSYKYPSPVQTSETVDQSVAENCNKWYYLDGGTPHGFDAGQDTSNQLIWVGTTTGIALDGARFQWAHPHNVTDLTATAAGAYRIDLSWSAVDLPGSSADGLSDADGYYAVYRSETSDGEAVPPESPTATTPVFIGVATEQGTAGVIGYSDISVSPNHTYYYKVYAWEADYSSDASPEATATTGAGAPPGQATITTGPADGATGVATNTSLNWTALDATSYDVYFDDGTGTLAFKGNQTAETYSPSGLVENHSYKWRIDARNPDSSTEGDVWTFMTGVMLTLTPSPIDGGTCDGGGYYAPGASVSPTATPTVVGGSGYQFVKWSTDADGTDAVALPYEMPSTDATLYAIFANTLKAVGARCGGSDWADSGNLGNSSVISSVSPCTGSRYRNCDFLTDWGNYKPTLLYGGWYKVQTTFGTDGHNSTVVRYTLYHKNGSIIDIVDQSDPNLYNTWVDLGMVEGNPTAYQFDYGQDISVGKDPGAGKVIEQGNAAETSSIHRFYDGCRWVWDRPNAVPDLTATRISSTEIDLAWPGVDMPPAGGYYIIERKTESGGAWGVLANLPGSGANPGAITYQDTSVAPGSHYHYRILAHQINDADAYSPETGLVTTSIGDPSESQTTAGPVTYTVTYGGATSITLAPSDVTLNTTGTANGTVSVDGTGTSTRTVTISSITGVGTIGISIAAGTAADDDGNLAQAAGPSATFIVSGPVVSYGLNNKAVGDAIVETASGTLVFTVWGKVTTIDADSFYVDDGSGKPVKVLFTGHGLADDDYASARGTLDVSGAEPVMTAQMVKKQN